MASPPPAAPSFYANTTLGNGGFSPGGSEDGGAHLSRLCTGGAAEATSSGAAPQLSRSGSVGAFLDLREVNISDDPPLRPVSSSPRGGAAEGVPRPEAAAPPADDAAASTPRAAPCIALPKQNAELLRHFAIGAAPRRAARRPQGPPP